MRRVSFLLGLALLPLVGATSPATATPAGPPPTITRTVHDGAEYRAALTELSADESGPHRIVFAADINIGEERLPSYTSTQPLTLAGQGHALRGQALELILGQSTESTTLTIQDLTMSNAAKGAAWTGDMVVRDSRFIGIGRGHVGNTAGPALAAIARQGHYPTIDITDSVFLDGLSRSNAISSPGRIIATGIRVSDYDSIGSTISGAKVRIVDSRIDLNRSRVGVAIGSSHDLQLTDTEVTRTKHVRSAPAIRAEGTVWLTRAIVRANQARTPGLSPEPAIVATNLRARHSVIRHETRACEVDRTLEWRASLASDRSCEFP